MGIYSICANEFSFNLDDWKKWSFLSLVPYSKISIIKNKKI